MKCGFIWAFRAFSSSSFNWFCTKEPCFIFCILRLKIPTMMNEAMVIIIRRNHHLFQKAVEISKRKMAGGLHPEARSFALTANWYLPGGNCANDTNFDLDRLLQDLSSGINL